MALSYATQEEAIRVGTDLRRQGQTNMIIPDGKGGYKIVFTQGTIQSTVPSMEYITEERQLEPTKEEIAKGQREWAEFQKKREASPEFRVKKGIQEKKIAEAIEKGTRLSEEEEINKEIETAARKVKVKKAMEQTPEEIFRATLAEKQMLINEQIRKKRAAGSNNPGTIVPIYDETTHQIIDYKWQGKGKSQTFMEYSKKGSKASTQTFATMAGNIGNVKAGINRSGMQTIGKGGQPKESIASLPRQMAGNIGSINNPPAIAQSLRPPEYIKPQQARTGFETNVIQLRSLPKIADGNDIIKTPSILTEGIVGQGKRLRQTPNVPRLEP